MKTKADLLKENNILEESVKKCQLKDRRLRENFAKVLNCYVCKNYGFSRDKELDDLSWEEIFFKVGELNSDANYTILLNEKEELLIENNRLREELKNREAEK